MDIKVNFSGRAIKYTEDEIAVVVEAMRNAEPLTQGKHLQAFQKAFGEYIGAEHCFAVMNGVSALEPVSYTHLDVYKRQSLATMKP